MYEAMEICSRTLRFFFLFVLRDPNNLSLVFLLMIHALANLLQTWRMHVGAVIPLSILLHSKLQHCSVRSVWMSENFRDVANKNGLAEQVVWEVKPTQLEG